VPANPRRSADPEAARADKERELRQRYAPTPLSADRLDKLPDELAMSEESRTRYAEVRTRYEELSSKARADQRRFLHLLPAAFQYDSADTSFTPVYTPELLEVLRIADRIGAEILTAETMLARALGELCDASKRPLYRSLRIARLLEIYEHPSRLPGARINLLEFLPKAGLVNSELAELDPVLDRYTDELARAIVHRHETLTALEMQRSESLVGLGPEWRAGRTLEEAREAERELARFDTAEVSSDIPLRELNTTTLDRIRRLLQPPQARRVMVAWQGLVHPELFEEERLFRIVLEEYVALPEISEGEISNGVDALVHTEELLWPLGQRAVEIADGVIVANRFPPTDSASARIVLESELQRTLMKRRSAVREALARIDPVDPREDDEARSMFATKLADARATLDAQDRASHFLISQLTGRGRELEAILAMGETPGTAADDAPIRSGAPDPRAVPVSGELEEGAADDGTGDDGAGGNRGQPGNEPSAESNSKPAPPAANGRGSRRRR